MATTFACATGEWTQDGSGHLHYRERIFSDVDGTLTQNKTGDNVEVEVNYGISTRTPACSHAVDKSGGYFYSCWWRSGAINKYDFNLNLLATGNLESSTGTHRVLFIDHYGRLWSVMWGNYNNMIYIWENDLSDYTTYTIKTGVFDGDLICGVILGYDLDTVYVAGETTVGVKDVRLAKFTLDTVNGSDPEWSTDFAIAGTAYTHIRGMRCDHDDDVYLNDWVSGTPDPQIRKFNGSDGTQAYVVTDDYCSQWFDIDRDNGDIYTTIYSGIVTPIYVLAETDGSVSETSATGPTAVQGTALDPTSDYVYVATFVTGHWTYDIKAMWRFDISGGLDGVSGEYATGDYGGYNSHWPATFYGDPAGYVNYHLKKEHWENNFPNSDSDDVLSGITGIAIDTNLGNMAVCDATNNQIIIRELPGQAELATTDSYDSNDWTSPDGICYHNGQLFVCDRNNHTLVRLQSHDLAYINHFGTYGTRGRTNTTLAFPTAVCCDGEHIYVAERINQRVLKLTLNLVYVTESTYAFAEPIGMTLLGSNLYVVDNFANRVTVLSTSDLTDSDTFGLSGSSTGSFDNPSHIGNDGIYLYVADTDNNRVQCLETDGTYVTDVAAVSSAVTVPDDASTITLPYGIFYYDESVLISRTAATDDVLTWRSQQDDETSNDWTLEKNANENIDWDVQAEVDSSWTEETAVDSSWTEETAVDSSWTEES